MKNKTIIIFAALFTIAFLLLGTGIVAARSLQHGIPPSGSEDQSDPDKEGFWGPMHGMGWDWDHDGSLPPMMEALVAALAEQTEISQEEILAQLEEGQHLFDVALEAGLSNQEFFELMNTIRQGFDSDQYDTFLENHLHMRPFDSTLDSASEDGFLSPCHELDAQERPFYGQPSQRHGRGW